MSDSSDDEAGEVLPAGTTEARERAVEALREGGLVVLPTDTVYGIVADAFNPHATRRLLRARGGGRNRPLPVLIRSPRQVVGLAGDVPESADRLMAAYWPGPLTLVLRAVPGLTWDLGNTADRLGLRIPTDEDLLAIVKEVGPLACTSAKKRRGTLGTTVETVREDFAATVACFVDGGELAGPLSTIVDASRGEQIEVLRAGAIPAEHILEVAAGNLDWGERPEAAEEDEVDVRTAQHPAGDPDAADDPPGDEE